MCKHNILEKSLVKSKFYFFNNLNKLMVMLCVSLQVVGQIAFGCVELVEHFLIFKEKTLLKGLIDAGIINTFSF
jgi:hypothetical protein